tara:strand:+ start:1953 stop:2081 length:129 start_codon:yes stop_codon:yes gene_type:complete
MPTNLRKFYLKKLEETKKRENDEMKKAQGKNSSSPPAFSPRR